ncbi:hypothetical protein ACJMQP_03445 [Rhodopseudomonas palustris]
MAIDLDKDRPVRFPITWLSYKSRIRRDLDRAYASEGGETYFDSKYVAQLSAQAKQLEEWTIKLLVLQIAMTAFQVVGFLGNEASISLFGVTLKQAVGVKEILIAFYATVALATWTLMISKETTLTILERLTELSTDESFANFGKIANPTSFSIKFYASRLYEDWMFPTRLNTALFVVIWIVAAMIFIAIFVVSCAVNVVFVLDIYRNPTLGIWSNFVLCYVGLVMIFGLLFIARFYVPQPYRDQSVLLELKALEEADPALYRRKRAEIYGPSSIYRKSSWPFRVRNLVSLLKGRLVSAKAAIMEAVCRFR